MHKSALSTGALFFQTYLANQEGLTIVDIGSQDVNGSLRSVAPPQHHYIGVDFASGNGVDVVLTDPYVYPFDSDSVDCIVSSSCFEHSEFFWLSFLEMVRILRPGGLIYLNVPSNGLFHRYPVDCWRFYPDSGNALARWANANGYDIVPLESFVSNQDSQDGQFAWNDFVSVFLKGAYNLANVGDSRIMDSKKDVTNGLRILSSGIQSDFENLSESPEDQKMALPFKMTQSLLRSEKRSPVPASDGKIFPGSVPTPVQSEGHLASDQQ